MTMTTSVKDRCRLCYTRLRDASFSHHKSWCSRDTHRIYNIYQRRPHRYRDLIVRYLYIQLPDNETITNDINGIDPYSRLLCGTCATSLNKLDQAYRTFHQTQKVLRSKFRKTSHIVQYQLDKQRLNSMNKSVNGNVSQTSTTIDHNKEQDEKLSVPKRQSKRKGEPKHIDQTGNCSTKKSTGNGTQLIVKVPPVTLNKNEQQEITSSLTNTRTSPRRKGLLSNNEFERINAKKKFKRLTTEYDTANHDSSNCINLLKPSILTDLPIISPSFPLNLTTLSSSFSSSNNRSLNSMKGNHIERIAVSLLSVS
jgi:hypothetical protein